MNRLKTLSAMLMLFTAILFGACTQDETMDDLMDNTEINSPSDPNDDEDGDKPSIALSTGS